MEMLKIIEDGFEWNGGAYDLEDDEEREPQLKIISGDFVEGGTVTVEICGRQFTRKVKYSARKYGDLYITVNGYTFTYEEFVNTDAFKDTDYSLYLK